LDTTDEPTLRSVGRPFGAVEIRIASENGFEPPPGVAGEVMVRGDVVMQGYWRQADATAETLRDGWLHTGDIGRLDERGYLTLIDRSKDLIISGGSNVYPRDIEDVLLRHPDVREAAVVGKQDEEWGEIVVAFVVPGERQKPTAECLDAWCIEHLARYKRPRTYRFVDELPKNENGKVLKRELRASLARSPE